MLILTNILQFIQLIKLFHLSQSHVHRTQTKFFLIFFLFQMRYADTAFVSGYKVSGVCSDTVQTSSKVGRAWIDLK